MSDTPTTLSRAEQEARLLEDAADTMLKSAAATLTEEDFNKTDGGRLEKRSTSKSPDEDADREKADEAEAAAAAAYAAQDSNWTTAPTVKDQATRFPDAVRMTDPETNIFNLGNAGELKEFNRIQKGASDPEAPIYAITEVEKQQYEGSWTVYVTFYKIQYLKL